MFGLVLAVMYRPGKGDRRDRTMALWTFLLGFGWYVIATKFVIPHFNRGMQPFYIEYFYSNYGKDVPTIVETMLRHPNRVISDATQPDRLRFYRDLALPLGGLPLVGPLALLMAVPQMLASVIGLSPYARSIHYQYTAMMIAPLLIAAIEGAPGVVAVQGHARHPPDLAVGCAYMTNVAWSPSPIGDAYNVWARPTHARRDARRVETGARRRFRHRDVHLAAASVAPHQIYDWPNPWVPSYWGNDDGYRLPDPSTIDYIVLDQQQVGEAQKALVARLIAPGGPYQVLFNVDDVLVAKAKSRRLAAASDRQQVLAEGRVRHQPLHQFADGYDHAVEHPRRHRAERLPVENAIHQPVRQNPGDFDVAQVDDLESGVGNDLPQPSLVVATMVTRLVVEAAVEPRHGGHEHSQRAAGGDEFERRSHLRGIVEDVLENVHVHDGIELLRSRSGPTPAM